MALVVTILWCQSKSYLLIHLQVSKLTDSVKEVSEKLMDCQRQHDQSVARADSTIQQLNKKLTEAISEASLLKAALETAALENESNQNEIAGLQRNLEMCTRDLNSVWMAVAYRCCEVHSHGGITGPTSFRQKTSWTRLLLMRMD